MTDLKKISNSRRKGPKFLGAIGDFLCETLDDDKLLEKLAPKYFNYWRLDSNRHSGQSARVILKDFRDEQLLIVKAVNDEADLAEMVFFVSSHPTINVEMLRDLRNLVSNRWSEGKLIAKELRLNKMCPGLVESLKKAGWKDSSKAGYLEIDLIEKYKRSRN